MKKAFRRVVLILVSIVAIILGMLYFLRYQTMQASPKDVVEWVGNDMDIEVVYYRPSKRDRVIFGGLVPFGETWRTGANEATTFRTKTDLRVNGELLPAGEYTLWTVPMPSEWLIIFNTKSYPWGVDMKGKASRDARFDFLTVSSSPETSFNVTDTFEISIDSDEMLLKWDQTKVPVKIEPVYEN